MTLERRLRALVRASVAAVATSLVLGLLAVVGVSVADAASLGSIGKLVVTPATGTNTTRLGAQTSGACPAGTVYTDAYVSGPAGSSITNMLVKGADNTAIWTTKAFGTSTDDAFSNIVGQTPGAVLVAGKYSMQLECVDADLNVLATYDGNFWFTTTTAYQNFDPASVATTTTLAAAPVGTAAPGANVTLTASITPSNAVGTVQFKDGGANLGAAVTVASGQAQLVTSALAAGSHQLSAVFTPTNIDAFRTSTSNTLSYSIASVTVATTTTLAVAPVGSAVAGDNVTLTATVSPSTAVGSVQFTDGGSNLGSAQNVVNGSASISTTALALGTHQLAVAFTPTNPVNFGASASGSTAYTIAAPGVPTSVTGALTANPATTSPVGSPVTFTMTLTPSNAVGTVQFTDTPAGGATVNLGSAQVVSGGKASVTTSGLVLGGHAIGAAFTPSNAANFTSATATPVTHTITAISTTTTLSTSPVATAAPGATVTLNAVVAPSNATGSVQFRDGATSIGAAVPVSAGQASTTTTSLALGSHTLTAEFVPSGSSFTGSTSSGIDFAVAPTTTTTTVTASPAGSAPPGSAVQLQATVTPSSATGTVQFTDAGVAIGSPVTVSAGVASLTTSSLSLGSHTLAATFTPATGSFAGSASVAINYTISAATPTVGTLIVTPAQGTDLTRMDLTTDAACPLGTVYVSATVTGPAGSGINEMLVKGSDSLKTWTAGPFTAGTDDAFKNLVGQTPGASIAIGKYDVKLSCANANLDTLAFITGAFWFTSLTTYQNSAPGTQSVDTAVTLTVSPDGTATRGEPVILTATLSPSNAVGTVQFRDSVLNLFTNLGSPVPVVNGVAKLTITTLDPLPTTHLLFAVFTPTDAQAFKPSTSTNVSYLVSKPPTATSVVPPSIAGSRVVGSVLTCRRGTWTGAQSYGFQWMRNGSPLPGATASTYRTTRYDGGASITCMVTASNAGGARSAVSSPLRMQTYLAPTKPIGLAGKAVVGRKLSAKLPTFSVAGASYSFQWFRGKKAISKATKASYKLTKADRGSKLRVRVVAKKAGYNTAVAYSRFSSKVR